MKTKTDDIQYRNIFSAKLNNLIALGNWSEAKDLLKNEMKKYPGESWLISNYAIVLYELLEYKEALEWSKKAYLIAPKDILIKHYHALILTANGLYTEGISIWESIIKKTYAQLSKETTSENIKWLFTLLVDIYNHIGLNYFELGKYREAMAYFNLNLNNRVSQWPYTFTEAETKRKYAEAEKRLSPTLIKGKIRKPLVSQGFQKA